MINWIRNLMLGRRRPHSQPPAIQPESLARARDQAARADEALRWVQAQDSVIDKTSERAERIHRANHLGPAFMRVLRSDRGEKNA